MLYGQAESCLPTPECLPCGDVPDGRGRRRTFVATWRAASRLEGRTAFCVNAALRS